MGSLRVVMLFVGSLCGAVGGRADDGVEPDAVLELPSEGRHAWRISDEEFAATRSAIVRRFDVPISASGTLTLDLRSTQVDPLIRVLAADGTQRFLDDDSGIEWNAHLELPVEAGETLHLEGISQAPHGGELELELRHGARAVPTGLDLVEATARFRLGRGGFQTGIGQHLRGASELHRAGEAFRNLRLTGLRHEAYTAMLAATLQLAESTPERPLFEAIARAHLAATSLVSSELAVAREHLTRAEELAAQIGNPQLSLLVQTERAAVLGADPSTDGHDLEHAFVELIDAHLQRGDDLGAARQQVWLAERLLGLGRLADAEQRLLTARSLNDGLGDPTLEVDLLLAELSVALGRGELPAARALAERAGASAVLDTQRATALVFLGDIGISCGRFGEAMSSLEQAIEIAERVPAPRLRAAAMQRMARVALELDDVGPAVALLRESLSEVPGGRIDAHTVERSLNLVGALAKAGRVDEADALLGPIEQDPALTRHLSLQILCAEVNAAVAGARGDERAELAHLERALELAREVRHLPHLVRLLLDHARVARDAGVPERAQELAAEALQIAESMGDTALLTDALVERSRAALASAEFALAATSFRRAEELVIENWGSLLSQRWGERLRAAERSERLARLGQDLAATQLAAARPGSPEWRAHLAEGLHRADRWKGRDLLSQRLALRGGATELDDLLGAVERRFGAGGLDLLHFAEGERLLYAYSYSDGAWRHAVLGELADIGDEVVEHLGHVALPGSLGSVGEVASSGARLHARLLAPLELDEVTRDLVVIDSGVLAGLPLESLVREAPAGAARFADLRFVLDDRRVSYAPSASALLVPSTVTRGVRSSELLVLADPDFGPPGAAPSAEGWRGASRVFPRLPGTRGEALAIARTYLSGLRSASEIDSLLHAVTHGGQRLDASGLHLRMGAEATRAALLEVVEEAGIVHLATHGVQDAREPLRSSLVLASEELGVDELLLGEILDWNLTAELAVLSACETASGSVRHGEGMRSLAWSFLRAGAGAVVATLWQVDDRESEVLMRDFYAEFLAEHDVSAALQNARLGLRHASAEHGAFLGVGRGKRVGPRPAPSDDPALVGHPFFWASFIHVRAHLGEGAGTPGQR